MENERRSYAGCVCAGQWGDLCLPAWVMSLSCAGLALQSASPHWSSLHALRPARAFLALHQVFPSPLLTHDQARPLFPALANTPPRTRLELTRAPRCVERKRPLEGPL